MISPQRLNQPRAYGFAVAAVVLFTIFEHGLTGINGLTTIDFYLACRVVVTSAMFLGLLAIPMGSASASPRFCLNPFAMTTIIWGRAVITVAYLSALAIALSIGGTQASAYPLFLLHPLWQVMMHRLVAKMWDITTGQIAGLAMIALGAGTYALGSGALQGTKVTALAQLAALLAGAGFALSNELGSEITTKSRSSILRNPRYADSGEMSSLEASAYNAVAGIWLLVPMLPLIWWVLKQFNLKTVWTIAPGSIDAHLIGLLIVGCAIITGGTWMFAQAMKLATSRATVSAVDVLILPLGIGLDWWFGKLLQNSADLVPMTVSTALIIGGVVLAAICEAKKPTSGRSNDKPGS